MNANDFFNQYSIEVINKRTRISPISLKYMKNKEFDKIPRVKFLGFVRIIENEFEIDLSEFIEEYNAYTNPPVPEKKTKVKKKKETKETKEPKKQNTVLLLILAVVLFSLGAYLLYMKYSVAKTDNSINEINNTAAYTMPNEENVTDIQTSKQTEKNIQSKAETKKTTVTTVQNTQTKANTIPNSVIIKPNEQVWYKAINLDNNKTVEYLTSNTKTLKGANWYIKFGHGNVTITYGDKVIEPKTKKILRILFRNGKVEYLKKPNRYEK